MISNKIAINMIDGIGPVKLRKLLQELGTVEAVAERLQAPLARAGEELENAGRKGISVLSEDSERYPELLKQIHDPPIVLYVRGELMPSDINAVSIVGTRVPTPFGLEVARRFARELASLGVTVVSGLAFGIDAAAHKGSLEVKGRTIAVLGSGVDNITPVGNIEVGMEILDGGGAIVSEYPLGTTPGAWSFPRRNRIISGLSRGVIVIEGSYKSGAMITAKLALEQGREVFAVPGNIDSEMSRGPHWLIKQGARLTESIDDVLDELATVLNIKRAAARTERYEGKGIELNEEEKKVFSVMDARARYIDEIVERSGMEVQAVSSVLLTLEIKGLVKPLPGKYFVVL
ncbi:MAG TPA: DNA-processing protein DprA [Candidatus Omnitrophota bacterium]|nr:DNA-processing protein DprA [Candidatus Omnitrophota bacterium]